MRTKKGVALLLTTCLVILLTGCGNKPSTEHKGQGDDKPKQETSVMETTVRLYYGDKEFANLVEREAVVTHKTEDAKYLNTLFALQTEPDGEAVSLFKQTTFHQAKLQADGLLIVDLSLDDEGRLGAFGELLYVEALKRTLFQFDEVEALEILVDGQQVESLMGHVGLAHPIHRQ